MDNKKPSVLSQSGRRKSGGPTQLRSPVVKRPAMAPVALQGWLHKQGSEGLMLWKKRWFVLSEYCLFYYKGPEEEKLLGSILLPSYKVSPCTAEDKIYRKFAFKAEHANMRTYYFAAESRELMTQWMNALSLATILQEGTKLQKPLNTSSMNSLSADDAESGFQSYRSRSGPVTAQPMVQKDGNVNGWMPQNSRIQPLYANAPPKPRRLNNEGQYGGSSPEPGRHEDVIYGNHQQIQQDSHRTTDYHYHTGQRMTPGGGYHSGANLPHPDIIRTMPITNTYPGGTPGMNARTPDYARSAPGSAVRLTGKTAHPEDYSDVYRGDGYSGLYRRPEGPVSYVKSVNPPTANYQHSNQYYQGYHQLPTMSSDVRYQGVDINRKEKQPPRPHSADFLDFDVKKSYNYQQTQSAEKPDLRVSQYQSSRPQRPKSSLDIMHANDAYYWSEENYAEKMRQSAIYLQNTLPQRSQSSRSNTPSFKLIPQTNRVPLGPGSGKSDQSSVVLRQRRDRLDGSKSPLRPASGHWNEYDGTGNQFVRSASARLAKNRVQDDESDEVQAYTGGEDFKDDGRKEESMKRLLEWKQRMLQSPLTRKPSGSSTRGTAQNELSKFYKQQVLKELERQEAKSREEIGKKRLKPDGIRLRSRSTDGRKSATSASRYNSYSSDDEENGEARKERNRRSSLSGRSRKGLEDSKARRSTPDSTKGARYLSPDYENVMQQDGNGCYQGKIPDLDSATEGPSNFADEDRYEKQVFEVKGQPTLVYPPHPETEKIQSWNEKIDETKLIKEFSYQYVNDAPSAKVDSQSYKVLDAPPENIVKSRIKQLGLEGKEGEGKDVNMKEPLKVSAPMFHPNEAHVSSLKNIGERRSNKSLRQFALGENQQPKEQIDVKESPNQKSVKDLLADFERKSQLVQEKENEKSFEESPGKRYVFSDTETLLYDTSSDTEDKTQKDSSILSSLKRPESRAGGNVELTEEEDGDEEVAAALGRRERFFSSCRDLGRKRDPESNRGKKQQKLGLSNVDVEPSPSSEVETIMTPGYLRSNIAESVAIQENSDSTCSTPVIEKIKDNLERTLPKENLVKSPDVSAKEEAEGHYMPMTPSRRVSAPPSDKSRSNSSLHSILYGVEVEETYVEMSENGNNNPDINKPGKRGYELSSYREIPEGKQESHYDFLYKSTTLREPEYMEVNTLLEILKEQDEKIREHKGAMESSAVEKNARSDVGPPTPTRAALPDILNSSTASQQKSDSSDADDESSKDLDSLDTPRHPRFSLSDTFRPASYYLGNDNSRNLIGLPNPSENHDSSDSDLVSPPPIPTSPPPLDDLDTSVETDRSLETRPKLKISEKDLSKKLWSKPNRSEFDEEYKKIKRRPVSEDILETLSEAEQSFYEKKLPISELDSIGSRNGLVLDEENGNINLDEYLDGLQFNTPVNPQLFSKNLNASIYKSYEKEMHKNLMPKESVSKTDASEKGLLKLKYGDEAFKGNAEGTSFRRQEEVQYENLQNFFPPPPSEIYDSGNDFGSGIYRNDSLADVPPPENYCDVYEPPEQTKIRFDPDTLQQQTDTICKNPENQCAPYYYSDIIKKDEEDFGSSTSDRSLSSLRGHLGLNRYQPLNNQREDMQEPNQSSKRNNIGRKVNPISQTVPCQDSDDLDDVQKITAELRTTSAHFMGAADKSGSFDVRNIYESDTLQRRKISSPTEGLRARTPDMHHPLVGARNLYPHGLKDKSTNPTNIHTPDTGNTSINRGRSRSMEGLLNDPQPSSQSMQTAGSGTRNENKENHLRINSCGDEAWEKDALWRENLRKASLRHTRSLDNLDDEGATVDRNSTEQVTGRRSVDHFTPSQMTATPTGRRSVDHYTPKPKLSRDVTYVNDGYRRARSIDVAREYEQDYREGRIRPKKREPEIQTVVELSDSGILDCDDGVHYERLTRNVPDKRKRGEMYLEGYEWDEERGTYRRNEIKDGSVFLEDGSQGTTKEGSAMEAIDREKLRQWDLMSSGIVEQQEKENETKPTEREEKTPEGKVPEGRNSECFLPGKAHPGKTQQQDGVQVSEASASGSVMREPHLPLPDREQRIAHQITTPLKSSAKEEDLKKMDTPTEMTDRIDYYDRGKNQYQLNGHPEWNDSYRKVEGVRDYIEPTPERRRTIETDLYPEQYQDRIAGMYNRHCGTLPMIKGTNVIPVPSLSSSMGRSMGTLDSRTSGKDIMGKRKISSGTWGLDVSAGELLGRTHEELVLLLIQLRRQSAGVCKAMETCHIEIEAQARLADLETPKRVEHLQKLEELKKHLLELEKQYEKGKPLVNLVDNMVKLGSLYRGNTHVYNGSLALDHSFNVREKLEFNQKVQEQRLLAEERRDWDRLSPDHGQLQAKVQQLYRLDRLLQEESGTIQSLQQDKELLEKALGGLRHKLQISKSNPVEADRYRKQQKLLEKELSRVRLLLAHNSKKLEETVAENARLEQELVILRQKLQASRVSSRNSVPLVPESTTLSTTAALEAELRRVQQLVGDLQRQRHELSTQVKQLTEKSDTLVQQIRPGPTGVAGAGPIPGKKKSSATWLETDLDLLVTQDVGVESPVITPQQQQSQQLSSTVPLSPRSATPIYINTEPAKRDTHSGGEESKSPNKTNAETERTMTYCTPVELSEADDRMKRFYGIIPREKQEIKTVRIVKRESERRQRDRDRGGNIGIPVGNTAVAKRVSVIEENDYGLGKVEEESSENYQSSPNFSEQSEDYQSQKLNGEYRVNEVGDDPYVNFHPTNPFLPQNIRNLEDVGEETVRSMSLPRGFGKTSVTTPSSSESGSLRNVMAKRNRVRFQEGSGSESGPSSPQNDTPCRSYNPPLSQTGYRIPNQRGYNQRAFSPHRGYYPSHKIPEPEHREYLQVQVQKQMSPDSNRPLTAREQLFGVNYYMSPEEGNSPQLSPVYQSEAAREIIMEISSNPERNNSNRRQIPREKRRHHTVSNIRHVYDNDNQFIRMGSARSRDDLDMERALRPRINAPDVVRSTMSHKDLKYNESTIDNILGTPNKIVIPERYIPEQEPALSVEEQLQRLRKAESIRKMLSETTAISTPDLSAEGVEEDKKSSTLKKKVEEEKKQREHLLELNQILAQQVMEKSKLVAVKALAELPLEQKEGSFDEDDLSPVQPLPLYQQRENYFS